MQEDPAGRFIRCEPGEVRPVANLSASVGRLRQGSIVVLCRPSPLVLRDALRRYVIHYILNF